MNNLESIIQLLKETLSAQNESAQPTEDANRFNADAVSVSKDELSSLSNELTNALNSFAKLVASQKHISDLDQAIEQASSKRETEQLLENRRSSPQTMVSGESSSISDAGVLSELTKEIEGLAKAIDLHGIGGGGERADANKGMSQGAKVGLAAGAGVLAVGTAVNAGRGIGDLITRGTTSAVQAGREMFSPADKAPPTSGSTQPKQSMFVGEAERGSAPRLTTQQSYGTSRYSDALASNIKYGIDSARRASTFSGGDRSFSSHGTSGDYGDGSPGGEVNPPTSGIAGLLYNEGKRRGYDDYMSIAFVALSEKETGLKPVAERMKYTADRAKAVFKSRAPQPHITDPKAFANHVYRNTNGNKGGNDGWTYRGKGLNQLTGRGNYAAVGKRIGYDLVKDPDAVMKKPEIMVKAFYEFYEGNRVLKGKRSAKNQAEANRLVTDATGGRDGFSSESAFGQENLAKVNKFSAKYSAGGLASQSAASGTRLVGTGTFLHPMANQRITSRFGPRNTGIKGASKNHQGIDYGPVTQGTQGDPIYASAAGVVSFTGARGSYGNLVIITHDGPLAGYETRYAHLKSWLVKKDQRVKQGQHIAALGNTGVSNAPHLHFEVRQKGTPINPMSFLGDAKVVPSPNETEPTNEDSGRNVSSATDTGPAPTPRVRPQVDVPSAEVAIAKKMDECNCPPPVIVGGAQRGPSPLQYLNGVPTPTGPTKITARNPAKQYKMYFAA